MELRDEIVESQKMRADLLKWKIILVAALGAVALGLESVSDKANGDNPPLAHEYMLCLIPPVCLYVDLLCSHLNLRIMVIARYFQFVSATRRNDAPVGEVEYEFFVEAARNLTGVLVTCGKDLQKKKRHGRVFSALSFEDVAQHLSSIVLSLLVFLWGMPLLLALSLPSKFRVAGQAAAQPEIGAWAFVLAGLAGIVLSGLAQWRYRRRLTALYGLVAQMKDACRAEPAIV